MIESPRVAVTVKNGSTAEAQAVEPIDRSLGTVGSLFDGLRPQVYPSRDPGRDRDLMAWVKIDDKIRTHPKFLKAGPVAAWLWLCGQSYCGDYLTDGFIPDEAIENLGVPAKHRPRDLADRLCADGVGLWARVPGGFRVHDYHDYQPSREHVEHVRAVRRQAGSAGGKRSGDVRKLRANGEQVAKQLLRTNEAKH